MAINLLGMSISLGRHTGMLPGYANWWNWYCESLKGWEPKGLWDSNHFCRLCPQSFTRLLSIDAVIHVMHDITWLHFMYYTKPDGDNSFEFVVKSCHWFQMMGMVNSKSCFPMAVLMIDPFRKGICTMYLIQLTTRSWRVRTRPTKLQD